MARLANGARVGDYEIVGGGGDDEQGGRGEFGITYIARKIGRLGQKIALKEYFPNTLAHRNHRGDVSTTSRSAKKDFDEGLDDFFKEAESIARFDHHRNIVKVIDFIEANGTGYIVMEWIDGETLAKHVGSPRHPPFSPMTVDQLRPILLDLLGALALLHEADPPLLHRDIKPANIMLRRVNDARGQELEPVLIDFGAARQATAAASQRLTTILTPGFAPYEQYVLSEEELDEAYSELEGAAIDALPPQRAYTDLYALGAVCHYALTGNAPRDSLRRKFGGGNYVPLVHRIKLASSPVTSRPGAMARAEAMSFLAFIDKALAIEPGDRFASARQWIDAIEGRGVTPPLDGGTGGNGGSGGDGGGTNGGDSDGKQKTVGIGLVVAVILAIFFYVQLAGSRSETTNTTTENVSMIDYSGTLNDSDGNLGEAVANDVISNDVTPTTTMVTATTPNAEPYRRIVVDSYCKKLIAVDHIAYKNGDVWVSLSVSTRVAPLGVEYVYNGSSQIITTSNGQIFVTANIPDTDQAWEGKEYYAIDGSTQFWREFTAEIDSDGNYRIKLYCTKYDGE